MSATDPTLALIHEGWNHLRLQRPLAAWGSWQRALRIDPENAAATEALEILADAPELPISARASYRFRTAATDERRARWTSAFEGRDLQDLDFAAETFRELARADPADSSAHYNLGLCLAWQGRNPEAIVALDRAIEAESEHDEAAAMTFWSLAEVLRQGAGAETWADDLSHSVSYEWPEEWGDPLQEIEGLAPLRLLPTPVDPATGKPPVEDARVAEWLDETGDIPRVLAAVLATPGLLRLSSPNLVGLMQAVEVWNGHVEELAVEFDWRSTPLPIRLMDAAVWLFRLPDGATDDDRRTQIEDYFENDWIQNPQRLALGDGEQERLSPAQAARKAAGGDVVARIKLNAVVNVREQLAARPGRTALYAGYPFDRLRKRLGILAHESPAVDATDVTCMSEAEIDRLDLAPLSDLVLSDALASAEAVCEEATIAKIQAELDRRNPGGSAPSP